MKIAGFILLILQVASLIPSCVAGDNPFAGGLPWLIGRFSLGIVGIILLIIAYSKNKK